MIFLYVKLLLSLGYGKLICCGGCGDILVGIVELGCFVFVVMNV